MRVYVCVCGAILSKFFDRLKTNVKDRKTDKMEKGMNQKEHE